MQEKQVYIASGEHVQPQQNWDAIYSARTLRAALRRLLPSTSNYGTMLGNQNNANFYVDGDALGSHLNELDDAASSRSSFADIWDSTSIEIRDEAQQRGDFNATTSLLLTCKSQVIYPYFYILSLVAWRPFHIQSFRYQGCSLRKILNIMYTIFIFLLIIFSYGSSIMACQARPIKNELRHFHKTTAPIKTVTHPSSISPHPTNRTNVTTPNYSTATPSSYFQEFTSGPLIYGNLTSPGLLPFYTLATPALWRPAVTECSHIFSTYVVPNVLHFLAFFIGFYLFRIQESEGLNALIEKVFLLSSVSRKIVSRLRFFLFGGILMVIFGVCNFIWFCYAFKLPSVTGFKYNTSAQWTVVCFMVLGKLVEYCVSAVTIVNYCAQCELLIFYLREINIRMEEKTKDLSIIMKKNLTRINGLISVIATLIMFSSFEVAVIGVVNLAMYFQEIRSNSQLVYRVFMPIIALVLVIVPVFIASRLTAAARKFKQTCLQVRVFGYPSASQLDLDSFVLFSHSAEMKAKLMFMPVHGSYLAAVIAILVFVLLLLLQTDLLASNNRYL
ncbi:unnamed protein product [Porites evermanni]|uniref:Gustatory receptor n=1 Tax=Porites evermanni TaxID=104178 RepID=A0ABN8MDF5_9CNID|nr:unnamed protein product [Porites evermanni]